MPFTKTRGLAVGHHGAQDGNETNFMTVDVSGTTMFSGPIQTSAGVSAAGSLYVGGSVNSVGPIKSGAAGTVGTAILVQRVTLGVTSTATGPATIVLPSGSNILEINVDVEQPFQTAAGVTATEINVSAAAGSLIVRMAVSASGHYTMSKANTQTVGTNALRNVTTTIEAHASIQGSTSVISAGQAMLSVIYVNV